MGKKLVIVESPAKAKTINKILGKDHIVKPSMGHVRDLPVKSIGVDVESDFKPKYTIVKGRQKVIDEIKSAMEQCDAVYLAPDPDREGEAIAWHLRETLRRDAKDKKFYRVQYNEITPRAVREAFEHPGELDMNRVNAQQARRILDRLVGYTVSPMLWRRVRRGLSAGRVQSVALRLLCERETEILNFKPEEYWILGALVQKLVPPVEPFKIKLTRVNDEKAEIKSSEQAERVRSELEGRELKVEDISTREVNKSPYPPHITSTLQQAASSYCGFSPSRTMSVAQKLYEGVDLGEGPVGLITYMRTDSFAIAREALDMVREFIAKTFGPDYCPQKPNFYKSKAGAQEAHEAIRPTDVNRSPESLAAFLDPAGLKVYRLIWQRFVASQMPPAKLEQKIVKIAAPPKAGETTNYTFQASASEVKFPGYMKATNESLRQKEGEESEDVVERLPPLSPDELLKCLEWLADRKETQPPARYTEASLIRALEGNGVGRPSTYAQIISTLLNRTYAQLAKRSLVPTDLGMQVNNLLVADLNELFNVNFTASMEESLDEIERGTVEWTSMLKTFYAQFDGWMKLIKRPAADREIVGRFIAAFEPVKVWAPETKRGKRTFSDKKFVESIQKQLSDPERIISPRQLEALAKLAVRYRDQIPGVEKLLSDNGMATLLSEPALGKPSESSLRKLEILKSVNMDESAMKFVDSLRSRTDSGRSLSEAQTNALNNIVMSHSLQIPDFEAVKDSLELGAAPPPAADEESGLMIEALKGVSRWKEPVKRGRRVFDDEAFYKSLSQHYGRKGFLSVRQKAALKKIVGRYRDQVPDYENLMKKLGATNPPAVREKAEGES